MLDTINITFDESDEEQPQPINIDELAEVYRSSLGSIRNNIQGWLDDGQVVPGYENVAVDSMLHDDVVVKFFSIGNRTLAVAEIKKSSDSLDFEHQIIEDDCGGVVEALRRLV